MTTSHLKKGKKVAVKLSLCLTNKALCHEDQWGSGCIDPHVIDFSTTWRWAVSFMPQPLYPGERAPGTHCIGSWMGLRAGLDDVEKRKFLTLPGLEHQPPGHPTHSQSLYRWHYPGSLEESCWTKSSNSVHDNIQWNPHLIFLNVRFSPH
jgi:hypothetical protein